MNEDSSSVSWLTKPFKAYNVRLRPTRWNTSICWKLELYGCEDLETPGRPASCKLHVFIRHSLSRNQSITVHWQLGSYVTVGKRSIELATEWNPFCHFFYLYLCFFWGWLAKNLWLCLDGIENYKSCVNLGTKWCMFRQEFYSISPKNGFLFNN